MAFSLRKAIENVTRWNAAEVNNLEEGVQEALTTAAVPAIGASGSVTVGAKGRSRKLLANIVGDGAKTTFKIPHGQGTFSIECTIQTNVAGHPSEITTTTVKIVAISENEIELTFAAAPTAGTVFWVSICT